MKYYIANWKMNLNLANITKWIEDFSPKLSILTEDKTMILAASFPYLPLVSELVQSKKNICTGAQNVASTNRGAFTGEVAAFQVKDFCNYAIIGHSERKENIETVRLKRDLCLEAGITPIICFVEENVGKELYNDKALMAWEDPSNISVNGVYRAKDPEEIALGAAKIRKVFPKEANLIYGGSVNRDNSKSLSKISEINGVLVGNASNDPYHFADIISNY